MKQPQAQLPDKQIGATLIAVLLFLLLITIVGVTVVRNSVTDLKISTNEQADALLVNAADNTNEQVTNIVNETTGTERSYLLSPLGFFGYYMGATKAANRGDLVEFCYRPREDYFFRMGEATVMAPDGGTKLVSGASASGGLCRVNNTDDYVNARQNIMTQVSVTRPRASAVAVAPLSHLVEGTSIGMGNTNMESPTFRINSASLIPAMGGATDKELTDCLALPSENAESFVSGAEEDDPDTPTYFSETRNECLARIGAPARVTVSEVQLETVSTSYGCIDFGVGTGQVSEDCQELLSVDTNGTPSN